MVAENKPRQRAEERQRKRQENCADEGREHDRKCGQRPEQGEFIDGEIGRAACAELPERQALHGKHPNCSGQRADQQVASNARIAPLAGEQAAPADEAERPALADERFEADVQHPHDRRQPRGE